MMAVSVITESMVAGDQISSHSSLRLSHTAAVVTTVTVQELGDLLASQDLDVVDVRDEHEWLAGHIPGARNAPYADNLRGDGTFKSAEELRKLYAENGITGQRPVIAYCRIGERSSHSWFVLKYLLGMKNVSNYDGSWTEWGNLVGAPVERGPAQPATT